MPSIHAVRLIKAHKLFQIYSGKVSKIFDLCKFFISLPRPPGVWLMLYCY